MMDRLILETLVARLKPHVGFVSLSDFSYYGEGAIDRPEYHRPGWDLLALAVLRAEDALASGDKEQMTSAAMRCPMLEREGNAVAERFRATAIKRKGGVGRGEQQRAAVSIAMRPYVEQFRTRVNAGVRPSTARSAVVKHMVSDEFLHPITGEFPSEHTIRKWLK